MERFLLRKTYKQGQSSQLLLTFGLFFILNEIVKIVWGTVPLSVAAPSALAGNIALFGTGYPIYRLFILAFSTVVLSGWPSCWLAPVSA